MPGRELRQVLAQDVLAGPALRRAAGEDRRQPLDDLAALDVGLATLLLAEAQLLERPARPLETRAELLARQVACCPQRRRSVEAPPTAPRAEPRRRRAACRRRQPATFGLRAAAIMTPTATPTATATSAIPSWSMRILPFEGDVTTVAARL